MKSIATGLLVVATAVFLLSWTFEQEYPYLRWLRVFAEAAMIGGIADWFAVTALFRRPLGLPLPHTAIIPSSKDRIAAELGVFIQENFLSAEVFRRKLQQMDIAGRAARYLSDEKFIVQVITWITSAVPHLVKALKDEDIRRFIETNIFNFAEEMKLAPTVGGIADTLIRSDREQRLLDTSLLATERFIDRNRVGIGEFLRSEMPWYVPGFLHDQIFDRIVLRLKEILHEVNNDQDHPLRKKYEGAIARVIDKLKNDPLYFEKGEVLKTQLIHSEAVQRYLIMLAAEIQERFIAATQKPDSFLSNLLRRALLSLGRELKDDQTVQAKMNAWAEEFVTNIITKRSREIAALISDTVHTWDKETITEKVELQLGKDLQFIRLNGMVVGGIVGLIINLVTWSL